MHILPRLLLHYAQNTIADVLPPHANRVRTALPSVEQERQRQMRAGSRLVVIGEGFNVVFFPRLESSRLVTNFPNALRRIIAAPSKIDRVTHQKMQHPQNVIRGGGRIGFFANDLLHMPTLHMGNALFAMFGAKSFDDAALGCLGRGRQAREVTCAII